MAIISALFGTLLMGLFSLLILLGKLSIWDQLPPNDKYWTCTATAYGILLLGSGWLYVCLKSRPIGCLHGLLMLGLAGLGGWVGFTTLIDKSVIGGRGPDANPMAGVIYGLGLFLLVLGVICAACGLGVLYNVLRARKTA